MVFYYTSHNLTEIKEWYTQNLNMTLVNDYNWVITLDAASGNVSFRPFHPNSTIPYNPASFIPHFREEFDGHGLSYTFNFETSQEVDRYMIRERNTFHTEGKKSFAPFRLILRSLSFPQATPRFSFIPL